MVKIIPILLIIFFLFFISSSNKVDQNDVMNDYRNFTLTISQKVASFHKISDIGLSEEVTTGVTNFCNVGRIVTENLGVKGDIQSFYSNERIVGICNVNKISKQIKKFQPLYNNLIDSANKLNSHSSIVDLNDFNRKVGEMNGKFIYFSNTRFVIWLINSFNNTLNVTQNQIEAGDEQLFELVGSISANLTPDLIKTGIHSEHVVTIMINETRTFFNISN